MHASTIATASQDQGASPVVRDADVPVAAISMIGIVIILPFAGGVLG